MKAFNTVLKVLTAIAAVAGAIYIIATYGEQIVAWAKRMLAALPKCPCDAEVVFDAAGEDETPVEETPAAEENTPAEPVEEPAPEVVVSEHEPVAEEADFAE